MGFRPQTRLDLGWGLVWGLVCENLWGSILGFRLWWKCCEPSLNWTVPQTSGCHISQLKLVAVLIVFNCMLHNTTCTTIHAPQPATFTMHHPFTILARHSLYRTCSGCWPNCHHSHHCCNCHGHQCIVNIIVVWLLDTNLTCWDSAWDGTPESLWLWLLMSCLGLSSTRRIVAHRSHCSSCCCGHHCGCCWVVWAVVAIVAVFAVDVTGHCNPCCGCCGEWIVVAVVQLVWVVENVPASCASWNCAVDHDSSSCDWYCSTMVSDRWHKKKCRLGNQTFSVMFCYSTLYNTYVLVLTLTFPFRLPYCRVLYMDYHWDHFCSFLPNSPSHATDQDMCPMTVQIHLLPILVVPGTTMATSSISGIPRWFSGQCSEWFSRPSLRLSRKFCKYFGKHSVFPGLCSRHPWQSE